MKPENNYKLGDFVCPPQDNGILILPNGEQVVIESDLHFLHCRLIVKQKKLDGCTILFQGKHYPLDINGKMTDGTPNGLFTKYKDILFKLV